MTILTKNPATNYVPPARRNNPQPVFAPVSGAKKTALKKEFSVDAAAFPSLGDTIKKPVQGTPISFSSAAAKKIAAPSLAPQVDVLPGWVHIRKYQGKIQYKYGKPILRDDDERAEEIMSRIILKNRIAREQYDRNKDIERLGDLSEFYDQPTLAEMYENAMEAAMYTANENESSDYTDSDNYE